MTTRYFSLLILTLVTLDVYSQVSPRNTGYPKSDLIESFNWSSEPYKFPGSGSDMHWWTWGIDDAIYLTDFMKIPFRKIVPNDKLLSRYVDGMIAVDSLISVSIYDYDWN